MIEPAFMEVLKDAGENNRSGILRTLFYDTQMFRTVGGKERGLGVFYACVFNTSGIYTVHQKYVKDPDRDKKFADEFPLKAFSKFEIVRNYKKLFSKTVTISQVGTIFKQLEQVHLIRKVPKSNLYVYNLPKVVRLFHDENTCKTKEQENEQVS